jgi:hypothetical protein
MTSDRSRPDHPEIALAAYLGPFEELKTQVFPEALGVDVFLVDLQHQRHVRGRLGV